MMENSLVTSLTASEIRERWGGVVSKAALQRMLANGKLKSFKLGGRIRVRKADLEAYERANGLLPEDFERGEGQK